MIDKMKSDSLTHLDPARVANVAMGGATAKVKWTPCICRMLKGDFRENKLKQEKVLETVHNAFLFIELHSIGVITWEQALATTHTSLRA